MKKKELLAMEKLHATEEMLQTAIMDNEWTEKIEHKNITMQGTGWKEKRRYRRYLRYLMAVQEGELLKVAIFTGDSLRSGSRMPVYEVYLDRKEKKHLTYEPETGRWRTAKVSFLEYMGKDWTYCQEEWQEQPDRDLVNQYFATGKNLSIYQAVLDFQAEQEGVRLRKKHQSEIDQIDAVMREVPEIPEDFEEWVEKNCFRETMFYEPRKKGPKLERMYCTHCREWMFKQGWPDGPEHKKEGTCPACGVKVTYRSWNKQKYVEEETYVGLLQRLKDGSGYILRAFKARRKRRHEDGWEKSSVFLFEKMRESLGATFFRNEFFEYGEYKYTGVTRWCHDLNKGCYWSGESEIGSLVMYTPNLKTELADCAFAHMDLETIFKGGSREKVRTKEILIRLDRYPFIEYLQKSGLKRMTEELLDIRNNNINKRLFDEKSKDIKNLLKLDGQQFQRIRQWDGGCRMLRALQLESETGARLSDENINYIISARVDMGEIETALKRTGLNIRQIINYYQRQQEKNEWDFSQTSRFYEDYLDMAEARGMDLRDDIVRRQARMKEFHDRYLEEKNRKDAEKRDKKVDMEFRRIREDYEQNKEHFGFECGDYVFSVPEKASDITREGRLQHHCVGASDTYLQKMDRGKSFIIFLRWKAEPDTPYYTIEATWAGEVKQWYAAYDRKPNEEMIRELLNKWTKEVKRREEEGKKKQAIFQLKMGMEENSSKDTYPGLTESIGKGA